MEHFDYFHDPHQLGVFFDELTGIGRIDSVFMRNGEEVLLDYWGIPFFQPGKFRPAGLPIKLFNEGKDAQARAFLTRKINAFKKAAKGA